MENNRFLACLNQLAAVFRVEPTEAFVEGYWSVLGAIDARDFADGCRRALKTCKFMPTPAELLQFLDAAPVVSQPALPAPARGERRGEALPLRDILPRGRLAPPDPSEMPAIFAANIEEAAKAEAVWRDRADKLKAQLVPESHGVSQKALLAEWRVADGEWRLHKSDKDHWRGFLSRCQPTREDHPAASWVDREPGSDDDEEAA